MIIPNLKIGQPTTWFPDVLNLAGVNYCSKSIVYYSGIRKSIVLATREGFKIYPEYDQRDSVADLFVIRVTYQFNPRQRDHIIQMWRNSEFDNTDLHDIIKEQWINNNALPYHQESMLRMEYRIRENELTTNNGISYIPVIDCVIAIGYSAENPAVYHPGNQRGSIVHGALHAAQHASVDGERNRITGLRSDFSLHVYIVDNHGLIGDRWIVIGGCIHKIIATKNSEVVDGIYVSRTEYRDPYTNGDNSIRCERYNDGENIPGITICRSYAEAKNLPDFQTAEKEKDRSLREYELRLKLEKTEKDIILQREKFQQELNKLELDKEKLSIERQLIQDKSASEKSSTFRKAFLEIVKFIPGIYGYVVKGALYLWGLVSKKKDD